MFIRGPHQEASVWRHFRGEGDGFTFAARGGMHEAVVISNADRAVELFLALIEHLDPAVRLEIEDVRAGDQWGGDDLALGDVRDAVTRLKSVLSSYAGAEVTIVSDDDQLTLTSNLEIFVFARTDRWLYLLQGKGLRRVSRLRPRSWRLQRGEFVAAPEVSRALRQAAERLGLTGPPGGR